MTQTANGSEDLLSLAKEQIKKGDLQAALVSYQKAIAVNPKDASLYCRLGDLYSQHFCQLQEALSSYQQALQIKPEFFWAMRGIGDILLQQGKLEEAIATYQKAIQIAPNNYEGYHNLASALEKKGELKKAKDNYEKSLTLKADNPWVFIKLGKISNKIKELDTSIYYYQQAIKFKPKDLELYNSIIDIQIENKNFLAAARTYQELIQLNPPNKEWLYLKLGGLYLYSLGKPEEATPWYSKFLEFHPDNFWANRDLGYAFDKQGLIDKAIDGYQKAINSAMNQEQLSIYVASGELQDAYLNLGKLQEQEGKLKEREATYQQGIFLAKKIILIDPDKTHGYEIYERLEELLSKDTYLKNVTEFYRQILEKYPHSFELNYRLGKNFAQQNQWEKALECYGKAIKINSNHWESYQAQGDALQTMGLTEEAQSIYSRAENKFYQVNKLKKSDLPENFDWEIYRQFNPGIAVKTKWEAIRHFLIYGHQGKTIYSLEYLHDPELRTDIAPISSIIKSSHTTYNTTNTTEKLAVLVHIYYFELWREIWNYIQNIEEEYDLFINIVATVWNPVIHKQIKEDAPQARITISKNCGRDLGGHLASMDTLDFRKYDLFCLVHTKKSPHLTEKTSTLWRQDLLKALLGSKEKVAENLQILRQNPQIGCIGSRYWRDTNIAQNQKYYEHFLDVLQIKPEARNCEYISGTMMLVRAKVMKRIYDIFSNVELEKGDDKELASNLDGQIAHAIERLIGNIVRDENMGFFWQE
jgi:tetratricopeptide (TPR) repeat protein